MVLKVTRETFKYFQLKKVKIQFIKILEYSKNSAEKEEQYKPKASRRREIKSREVNETENNKTEKNPQNQNLVILSMKLINR